MSARFVAALLLGVWPFHSAQSTESPETLAITQTPAPETSLPVQSAKIAEVGHSLVNEKMPMYLVGVATEMGKQIALSVQIINGAPLEWQWNRHADVENRGQGNLLFTDLRVGLKSASPPFDVLVITERVDISASLKWHNSPAFSKLWRDLAVQANPSARVFMYTTWTGYANEQYWPGVPTRAAWRTRTQADGELFEKLVRDTNALIRSGPKFMIIPGHRAMMAIYDAIQSGAIDWATAGINHFFIDDIHLNDLGNYYIALVQYATIYRSSPAGAAVPKTLAASLTAAQALQLQQMAWNVVSEYPLSGVTNSD